LTQNSLQALRTAILEITTKEKPETVEQLAHQVHDQFPSFSNQQILNEILTLQGEDKIRLTQTRPLPTSLVGYLKSSEALWYWMTLATTLAAILSVFSIPESAYPAVIIRYVLGAIFVLWLPGYAFMKALFPNRLPFSSGLGRTLDTSGRDLDTLERVVLSIGMSLALVPIVGLLLNYTPWGIRLTPITLSLTALTLAFSTAAIIREYQTKESSHDQVVQPKTI
jgi:Protein of unknown function (DUF1616)